MSSDEDEWVRLPGLFRWDEVCDVFASEAVPDHEWRFLVQLAPPCAQLSEPLYVVLATSSPVRPSPPRRKMNTLRDARESSVREPPR